jgi:predicted amidohydrolase
MRGNRFGFPEPFPLKVSPFGHSPSFATSLRGHPRDPLGLRYARSYPQGSAKQGFVTFDLMKKLPVIAIAAIRYYDIVKSHNVKKIVSFIGKAKKLGADIVCFPESCITKRGNLLLDDRLILEIREACKKHTIWCIVTEDVKIGRKVYNSSLLIGRDGKIKGHYDKINLYGDTTAAGNQVKVFKTDFARIGIAICWDLAFPGMFHEMRKKGAEIVFCPAQWNYDLKSHPHSHKERETTLLRAMTLARAHENILYIALCNPLMPSKTQVSYSAIADPHSILKELIDKEGVITAPVDIAQIRKFRKFYKKSYAVSYKP